MAREKRNTKVTLPDNNLPDTSLPWGRELENVTNKLRSDVERLQTTTTNTSRATISSMVPSSLLVTSENGVTTVEPPEDPSISIHAGLVRLDSDGPIYIDAGGYVEIDSSASPSVPGTLRMVNNSYLELQSGNAQITNNDFFYVFSPDSSRQMQLYGDNFSVFLPSVNFMLSTSAISFFAKNNQNFNVQGVGDLHFSGSGTFFAQTGKGVIMVFGTDGSAQYTHQLLFQNGDLRLDIGQDLEVIATTVTFSTDEVNFYGPVNASESINIGGSSQPHGNDASLSVMPEGIDSNAVKVEGRAEFANDTANSALGGLKLPDADGWAADPNRAGGYIFWSTIENTIVHTDGTDWFKLDGTNLGPIIQ